MTVRDSSGIDSPRSAACAAIPVPLLRVTGEGPAVLLDPPAVPLASGQCQLWRLPLDLPPAVQALLETCLCDAERERARAFRMPGPRRDFVVTRAVLRLLLARHLDIPADACRFEYGQFGKPRLSGPGTSLQFNVSHSGQQALFAVAEAIEIGVDLEWQRTIPELASLAATILSARQLTQWERLPPAARKQAFHDAWARKEAVIKAVGAGLSLDLQTLDVAFLPGAPSRVLRIDAGIGPAAAWTLLPLDVGTGYSAAVAARVPDLRLA